MLHPVLRSRYFFVGAESVWRSGSGSTLDKTEEILKDMLFRLFPHWLKAI